MLVPPPDGFLVRPGFVVGVDHRCVVRLLVLDLNWPFPPENVLPRLPHSWIPRGCSRPSGHDVIAQRLLWRPIKLAFTLVWVAAMPRTCTHPSVAAMSWACARHLAAAHLPVHLRPFSDGVLTSLSPFRGGASGPHLLYCRASCLPLHLPSFGLPCGGASI
jgi:hypothetical protein